MTDDLARIAEVLEDSATRATNAVQRHIINNNALAIRDAKARIEALTAERDDWKKRYFKIRDERDKQAIAAKNYADFNHEWRKRAERAEADNARLRAAHD